MNAMELKRNLVEVIRKADGTLTNEQLVTVSDAIVNSGIIAIDPAEVDPIADMTEEVVTPEAETVTTNDSPSEEMPVGQGNCETQACDPVDDQPKTEKSDGSNS